jgi:polyphosphate glucokinase
MNVTSLVACHSLTCPTVNTLAIDIGGSGLKATVLDASGAMLCDRVRIDTPVGSPPDAIVALLVELVRDLPAYDRIAIGFPGMVRDGIVRTAPNLGHDAWRGYALAAAMQRELGRPVRLANDADVHGLAVIGGRGIEMVVTLGTGFGTALYDDGRLCPHLELSHHRFRKGETYDQQLGNEARKRVGRSRWQKRVLKAIDVLRELVHFDHLYIGGGNAKKLCIPLPDDITIVDNLAGLSGGARLWQGPDDDASA